MLAQDAIEQQRELLTTHRRTLAHLLRQQATLTSAHTPPSVAHGIDEARENIRRIKTTLRVNGIEVDDYPDDELPTTSGRELLAEQNLQNSTLVSLSSTLDSLDISTPEGQFWKWFIENSSKLSKFALDPNILPSDDDPMIQELNAAFAKVAEGLTFELSGPIDFGREFIISADGNRGLFSTVLRLANTAPVLSGWKFIAFRQNKDTHFSLTFRDIKISGDDIWFKATPNWEKLDLVLYIKGLTRRNHEAIAHASFIMLDNALGEYDVETKIGDIDWKPLPTRPEKLGLKSFHSLPDIVQGWKPLDPEEAIKAFIESAYPLRVFLCHSSKDKPTVRNLYRKLLSEGFNPWLDEENILPGQDWRRAIESAVKQAETILVCLSLQSLTTEGYIQQEIKQVLEITEKHTNNSIFLIPVRLENCIVPESLSRWQWVNLFEKRGYERLIQALTERAKFIKLHHFREHFHKE